MLEIISYINTLIFTILAATMAVVIMFLLFDETMQDIFAILVVIEIGLIIIVVWALASIINYDNKLGTSLDDALKGGGSLPGCPDHWTQVERTITGADKSEITTYRCVNQTDMSDANTGTYFQYTIGPSTVNTSFNIVAGSTSNNQALCDAYHLMHQQTPWTSLKSKCDTLRKVAM